MPRRKQNEHASNAMPPSYPPGHRDVKPLNSEERRLAAASDNRQDPIRIAVPAWFDEAACVGVDMHPDDKAQAYRLIRRYCRVCPVLAECDAWGRSGPNAGGIWGGLLYGLRGEPLGVQPRYADTRPECERKEWRTLTPHERDLDVA